MEAKNTRKILADNLARMIRKRKISARGFARELKVCPRTFHHILSAKSSTGIDTIELLARDLGLETWQLLVPNMGEGD